MTSAATRARIEGPRPVRPKPAPVVLLVETAGGDVVGVRFPSSDAARDWEDEHPGDLTAAGCVRLVSRSQALEEARA